MSGSAARIDGLPAIGPAIRRQWLVIVLCTLAFLGLAGAYIVASPSSFTSTSRLLLFPAPGNPLTPDSASASSTQLTIAMETEAGIVRTPEVEALAGDRVGREIPGPGESMFVRVPGGTQVVEITFNAGTAVAAADGAQAFSEAFLDFREARALETQQALLATLEAQATTAEDNLRRAATDAVGGVFAQQEVQLFTERLAQLNERISSTQAVSTVPGRLINPAEVPESGNSVSPFLVLAAAGVLGLLIGTVISLFREWRRDLVRDGEQSEVSGIPVFATLSRDTRRPIVTVENDRVGREAYRRLLAGVVANGTRPHVLAVSAIDVDRVTSDIASNLAVALSEARFSVLLIAADPEDRGVEHALDVPVAPGLSEVVNDGVEIRDVLVSAGGVTVMPGGAKPESVRELYAGPQFRSMIDSLRSRYDYIVLASSSAGTGDGDAVISAADSVLLSVTSSRTTYRQVSSALDRFGRLGIEVIGAVLTRADDERRGQIDLTDSIQDREVNQVRRLVGELWPNAEIDVRRTPALFSSGTTYAMLPSRSSPTRLLPTRPRRAAIEAAKGIGLQAKRSERLKSGVFTTAVRLGAGVLLPNTLRIREGSSPGGSRSSLVSHLRDSLDREFVAGIQLGPPRANRKPVLQLISPAGRTIAFVKVGVNPLTRERIQHETHSLGLLADAGLERLTVPSVLRAGTWRNCEYLVLSPLRTLSGAGDDEAVRGQAMRDLVDAFDPIEVPLATSTWWSGWSRVLDDFSEVGSDGDPVRSADALALKQQADRLEATCGDRMLLVGAAHGDWTPWNMSISDGQASVWDWERFAVDVPVGWDALHYAFQSEVRLGGSAPRDALRLVSARSRRLVADNGAFSEDGPLLMALYALRLGSRFVVDGQGRAGERSGALSQWLLPELEELTNLASKAPVDAS